MQSDQSQLAISAYILALVSCWAISVVPNAAFGQNTATDLQLESRIAELKLQTAELVASGLATLNTLSAEQRLSAPPAIWKVSGALTEFKDCADCPQMVVVPAGEFTMGSPPSEQNAETQHRVTIGVPFAVSKFEITFDDWDLCVREGGCGSDLSDNDWGRGNRPAIHVSWNDAKVYVGWLSKWTGKPYRLLSESE